MPPNDEVRELIDMLVHMYGVGGLSGLSKKIGIDRTTLSLWRSGKRKASEKGMEKLRKLAGPAGWGSPEFVAQSYMAYNTTAFDVAGHMYDAVAADGDPMMMAMASVSIQAKLAGVVTDLLARRLPGVQPVACIKALYGDPDAASVCEYTFVDMSGSMDRSVLFTVRAANMNDTWRFMHTATMLDNGLHAGSVSGVTTDLALDRAAADIVKFIKPRK